MAIYMDKPNGDGWAHLVSDLPEEVGRQELLAFAKRNGLFRRIHRTGSYAEHLDIRGGEVQRALAAGARTISRRELALLLRSKKQALAAKPRITAEDGGRTGRPYGRQA